MPINLPIAERGVIASIQTPEQLRTLQSIRPTFEIFDPLWQFVLDYFGRYQSVPTNEVYRANLPDWQDVTGEFEYWLDEYIKARQYRDARLAIQESLKGMDEDPSRSIRGLITRLEDIGYSAGATPEPVDSTAGERFERYLLRSKMYADPEFKLWGIPTGITAIDRTKIGWMPGELIGFYARPTVGKTWMLIRSGVVAWQAGYRVLLISPEMPASQINYRIDAVIAGQLGIPISHGKIITGDPSVSEHYRNLTEKIKTEDRWWTVDTVDGHVASLNDIRVLYQRYRPDVILIDGISLIESDDRKRAEWESMKAVCYGLKTFATDTDVVVIASHQAVNSRRGQRSNQDVAQGRGDDWVLPSLNDAAYGDSFVQAMSTVFTMAPDRDEAKLRWYSIRKTRDRQIDWQPRMALGWDVDRGLIVDLGEHGDDEGAIAVAMKKHGIDTGLVNIGERIRNAQRQSE